MEKNAILFALILAGIVGSGAFFAGMKYQEGKQPSFTRQGTFGAMNGGMMGGSNKNNDQRQQGQMQGQGSRNGARGVMGEIIANDDKSITVKLSDGSSKIVLIGTTTAINKATQGAKTDLTNGINVMVFGSTNTDGSVTAENIQINPMMQNQATTPAVKK